MNNESGTWENITDRATAAPSEEGKQDGYVLLLVLLSVFIGGTLVILSGLLIICRRCCEADRRYSRASDDPEKTNTTYLEEAGPPHAEITIRVDEVECLSASSYHDAESERFLSTCSTGRRVSFNEAALFDQGKKAQEKGRRYTLTEGDFHHLKNARLTHLHIPSPTLKIVTIHEGDTGDTNSIAITPRRPSTPNTKLFLFQPPGSSLPQTALTTHTMSPSSPLPGDTFNSTVDSSFLEARPGSFTHHEDGTSPGAISRKGGSETSPSPSQGAVLQFFTRLRRHASLEGASPYFKIKKWKLESSQRASSLDMRGSPKRHQFQRQRAASESMEQEDRDPHQTDIIQFIARTEHVAFRPLDAPFLPRPSSPPPSLGRLEGAEAVGSSGSSDGAERAGGGAAEPQTTYHDIWSLRASLELNATSEQSSSNNDRDSVRSDAESISSLSGVPSFASQDPADDGEVFLEKPPASERSCKQEGLDSERGSDGDLSTRKLLQMDSGYASIEAPSRLPEDIRALGAKERTASEKRLFFTHAGRKGTVFASFDSKVLNEELEDEGAAGGSCETPVGLSPYGQMQRRDYSIDEKTDALFNEFLRHDPQFDDSPLRSKHRSRVHLRKQWQRAKQYSDPGVRYPSALERQRTPLRRGESANYPLDNRYHSTLPRIASTADEEPGEASGPIHLPLPPRDAKTEAGPPTQALELEEKVQAIQEEPSEPASLTDSAETTDLGSTRQGLGTFSSSPGSDEHLGYGPQTTRAELMDKISMSIEDRLYCNLRKPRDSVEHLVTVAHTSPDHSPV
ncbi:voltage-dependent calcium channel beta subunit-associated regulatory protein isoform X1 [Pleurodeles waltl]|uniref:voltage-dependent calcium channel beta subunit-associated regulatory protein isoform X1 n=1 Tax=Pleurodeles waltl TaxID=8319 RepID=UPI0037094921